MTDQLLNLALAVGDPVLWILIAVSGLSIAVVLERAWIYATNRVDVPALTTRLVEHLNAGDVEAALADAQIEASSEGRVVAEGLRNLGRGDRVARELMEAAALREQQRLDRRLGILGTIGSNAPFVGLLGTVLGIIRAFVDLSRDAGAGPSVVMAGIAEALVATATGLVVAIPAVVAFNAFKGRQRRILGDASQLAKTVLAFAGEARDLPIDAERRAA